MNLCACGKPVHIKKSGECATCYNRRYARDRAVVKRASEPDRVRLTLEQMNSILPRLESELREHERVLDNARAQMWKRENPRKVQESKAAYRLRERQSIRTRDADYRARNVAARREAQKRYYQENRDAELARQRAYAEANAAHIAARKAVWHAANRERISERRKGSYVPTGRPVGRPRKEVAA